MATSVPVITRCCVWIAQAAPACERTWPALSAIARRSKSRLRPNLAFRPAVKFLKCYLWKRGFLDGWPGFIIAFTSAFYVLSKYAKLYEMRLDTRPPESAAGEPPG